VAASCAALAARPAAGQTLLSMPAAATAQASVRWPASVPPAHASALWQSRPWLGPVASLLVPGTGQLLAGQSRGMVYLAAEVWLAARALALRHTSRTEAQYYTDLAYAVARRQFGSASVNGAWSYYEEMGKYVESGFYDRNPSGTFQPETDTATFNGHIWRLARQTYLENPDALPPPEDASYRAALTFYQGRAVTDAYRWSWRNARLEQDVYRASIRASDDAYRASTNVLGAILLNHLVSAVDAFVTARLRRNVAVPQLLPGPAPGDLRLTWHTTF
jgi:hypothetical protein